MLILGKISASLIHDIRNPLSAIFLSIEYLNLLKKELPEDAVASLEACAEGADRIQILIENLLSFSRKAPGVNVKSDINSITKNAITVLAGTAKFKNCFFTYHPLPNLQPISFNPNNLMQIFLNLMTNAIEASQKGGEIYISIQDFPESVIWRITDRGVGIADSEKDKIFNDFYSKREGGVGFGLSVCTMLLKQNNGKISFESKIGHGSEFTVTFNKLKYSK